MVVAVVAAYSEVPGGTFQYDDYPNILHRDELHLDALTSDRVRAAVAGGLLGRRWFANATLALDWWRGGGTPAPFLWTNLLIHVATALAVFALLQRILRHTQEERAYREVALAALVGTTVWAVHPIQVQAVAYIVQRMASLSTLFVVLSVYAYLRGRQERRWGWLAMAGVTFVLGLGSKENALVTPALWLLAEFGVVRHGEELVRHPLDRVLLALPVLVLGYLTMDLFVWSGPVHSWASLAYEHRDFTMGERLMTQPRVIAGHLGQLVVASPSNFSICHAVEPSKGLFEPWSTFAALLGLLSWCGVGAYLVLWRIQRRVIGFLMLWVPITLFTESSFVGLHMVMEHRMYMPTIAFAGLVAMLVLWAGKRSPRLRLVVLGCGLLATVAMVASTRARVTVWGSEVALWSQATRYAPGSALAWFNLSTRLMDQGDEVAAQEALQEAMRLDFTQTRALRVSAAKRRVTSNSQDPMAWVQLGAALNTAQADLDEVVAAYQQAVLLAPQSFEAHLSLSGLYQAQGKRELAFAELTRALNGRHLVEGPQANWERSAAFYNRGLLSEAMAQPDAALSDYTAALRLHPTLTQALSRRAVLLASKGHLRQALDDLVRAARQAPNDEVVEQRLASLCQQIARTPLHAELSGRCCKLGIAAACSKPSDPR